MMQASENFGSSALDQFLEIAVTICHLISLLLTDRKLILGCFLKKVEFYLFSQLEIFGTF